MVIASNHTMSTERPDMWYHKGYKVDFHKFAGYHSIHRNRPSEEEAIIMKAVKTHVGRCDTCGEPAAYAQLLSGGRRFNFCAQHAPLLVKKSADAASKAETK